MNKECPSADKTLLSVAIFQPAAWIITHVARIRDTEGFEASACRLATQALHRCGGPWPSRVTEVAAAITSASSALSLIVWHRLGFPSSK